MFLSQIRRFSSVPLDRCLVAYTNMKVTKQFLVKGTKNIEERTEIALHNIGESIRSFGSTWEDVVEARVYIKNPQQSKKIVEVLLRQLNCEKPPEIMVVPVRKVPEDALLQISFHSKK